MEPGPHTPPAPRETSPQPARRRAAGAVRTPGAALLAACSMFAACAANAPALPRQLQIQSGDHVRVVLQSTQGAPPFVLQNASSTSRADVYSRHSDAMIKVVDDGQLQTLLDVLAAEGMFAAAQPAATPGARATLTVEREGERYVWSRPPARAETIEQINAFEKGRGYVLAVYNATTGYHSRKLDDPEARGMRSAIEKSDKPSVPLQPARQGSGQDSDRTDGAPMQQRSPLR